MGRWSTCCLVVGAMLIVAPAFAQLPNLTPAPAPAPATTAASREDDDLQSTEQEVSVDDAADDDAIARRLADIYDATGRYTDLDVEVRDGIVFLRGVTQRDAYREQATQIARRTQDVVAVVNDLEVVPPPVLEQYAFDEELRGLWRELLHALPLIVLGLVVLLLALLLAGIIGRLASWPVQRWSTSRLLQNVTRKVVAVLVVCAGLIVFLRITGLTTVAVTVASGTGLLGLIIGFAFRDIAENFLASVLLSVQTPFNLGDVVEVAGYTGIVRKVTTRGTVLVDFDGNHITLANSTVYKSALKNYTANPNTRLTFTLGVGYDADLAHAQAVIRDALRAHDAVLDEPEPLALAEELGSAAVTVKVYFWINTRAHSMIKARSSVMRHVLAAVDAAGVSLPDEAREVVFPQGVPINPLGEAPRKPERRTNPAPPLATAAEDNLESEVGDLQRQADAARDPEAGTDIVTR